MSKHDPQINVRPLTLKDLADFGVEPNAQTAKSLAANPPDALTQEKQLPNGNEQPDKVAVNTLASQDTIKQDAGSTLGAPAPRGEMGASQRQIDDNNEEPKAQADLSANEVAAEGEVYSKYETIDFESPAELINFYDEGLNSGQVTLHTWQMEVSDELACLGGRTKGWKPTAIDPLKYVLVAANGSGKDAYVMAPTAVWFILTRIRARVILTSSSGTQLTAQTESYISALCHTINAYHGEQIFKVKQRYIRCMKSGSEIRLFATDEAGKAEGYHPFPDHPGAEMMIGINEAKSVKEEIFQALTRCTGYNYWLEISTPEEPNGHLYYAFTHWLLARRVTAFECPHLGQNYIDDAKMQYGVTSAFYRSMILAEFTSLGGQVVLNRETVDKCLVRDVQWQFKHWQKRIGIDLAAGGDETSLQIWQGNKRIEKVEFREEDTTITAEFIDTWLKSKGIPKTSEYINADDGGIGHAIIDMLVKMGWKINRVLNQSAAINKRMFGNRGAELWFRFARLVEEGLIVLPKDDEKLLDQLSHRYYKQASAQGRITLQSKKEAKAEGYPSPDRADAAILSFAGLTIEDFLTDAVGPAAGGGNSPRPSRIVSQEELVSQMGDAKYAALDKAMGYDMNGHVDNWAAYDFATEQTAQKMLRKANGSLSCALAAIRNRN